MPKKFGIVIDDNKNSKRLIGCIWVVDSDLSKIASGNKPKIERLELYSHAVTESANMQAATKTLSETPKNGQVRLKSLLLDSCPGAGSPTSYVSFQPEEGASLKLLAEDGTVIGVKGTLQIVTRLRSPLFFANAQIQLEFLLDNNAILNNGSVQCTQIQALRNNSIWPLNSSLGKWDLKSNPSSKVEKFIDGAKFNFTNDLIATIFFTPPLLSFSKLFSGVAPLISLEDWLKPTARWSVEFSQFRDEEEHSLSSFKTPKCTRFGLSTTFLSRLWRGIEVGMPKVLPFMWQYKGGFYAQKDKLSDYQADDYDIRLSTVSVDDNSATLGMEIIWKARKGMNSSEGPLNLWNETIARPYVESLDSVKRGTPGSVMPVFGSPDANTFSEPVTIGWSLNFDMIDNQPHEEKISEDQFPDIRFTELTPIGSEAATITCYLPNFKDHNGHAIIRSVRINSPLIKDLQQSSNSNKSLIHFSVTDCSKKEPSESATSRAGALDLEFSSPCQQGIKEYLAVPTGDVKVTSRHQGSSSGAAVSPFVPTSGNDVLLELNFRLDSFKPGGQDPAPPDLYRAPEERQSGLLLPYPSGTHGGTQDWTVVGPFVLVCKETSTTNVDHSLELRLERESVKDSQPQPSTKTSVDIIILDFSPLLIGRVQAGARWTDEIGNWSSRNPDEASWELGDLGEGMRLLLPPQSVGEEFLRNYDDEEQTNRETQTIFYTFSPITRAKLLRSPFEQSFSEAPWNLRRLLGNSGQRMPGAELVNLEFELLYGLEIDITAEGLLLAEFGARVGRLPAHLSEATRIYNLQKDRKSINGAQNEDFLANKYGKVRTRQNRDLDALTRRLAMLEPWHRSSPQHQLRLASGIVCEVRASRLSRPHFIVEPVKQVRLKGGFDWAFESRNIYTEVITNPRSVSAYLANPSLSALGGSGYQEATYANGKTKVYASTYVGRTFFYSLERKGRIGCLWNKAKHVIIYERTVSDTEQFESKQVADTSRLLWQGRPMVRKVREFVEILEAERSYEASARSTGCVLASRFGQKVIPVDSAWGYDIDNGWVVPLYKKCSGAYYKPPAIYFKLAVADKNSDAFVWGRIRCPELLVFYTNTDSTEKDDSDTWPAVLGVDYPLYSPQSAEDEANNDGLYPVPTGMGRFTYEIDTGNKAVNILKHRQANAVEALLSNVTLVRRTAAEFDKTIVTNGTTAAFLGVNEKIEQARNSVLGALDTAQSKIDEVVTKSLTPTGLTAKELEKLLDGSDFKDELEKLTENFSTNIQGLTQPFKNAGESIDLLTEQQLELTSAWQGEWARRLKDWTEIAERVVDLDEVERSKQLDQLKAEMKTSLHSAELAVGDVARACEHIAVELEAGVKSVEALCGDASNLLNKAQKLSGRDYYILIARLVRRLEQQISESRQQLGPYFQTLLATPINNATGNSTSITEELASLEELLWGTNLTNFSAKNQDITKQLTAYKTAWEDGETQFKQNFIEDKNSVYNKYTNTKKEKFDDIDKMIDKFIEDLKKLSTADNIREAIKKSSDQVVQTLDDYFANTTAWTNVNNNNYDKRVVADIKMMIADFSNVATALQDEFDRSSKRLKDAVTTLCPNENGTSPYHDYVEVRQELAAMVSHSATALSSSVTSYEHLIEDKYRRVQYELSQIGDLKKFGSQTLSLVRAYGKSPLAESLRLERDKLAYHFDALKDVVDFAPTTVLVNGAENIVDELKSLSISLPSKSLGNQFVSNLTSGLSIGDVLPDFSGVKIAKLLKGVAFPLKSSDDVRIKHGFDEQTKRAWVKTDVAIPVGDVKPDGTRSVQLFALGPVEVNLESAFLEAHTGISVDTSRTTSHSMDASISGNWIVTLSKRPLLSFKKTKLEFDSAGRSRFKLDSKNVDVHPPLNFISELLDKCKIDSSSGVTFELTRNSRGVPTGARALLNLVLPALQTGAFSISNLSLSAYFAVAVEGGDFRIGTGLSMASKNRPFILTVLFLGGGGWFTVDTSYSTSGSGLSGRVSLGISAGAAFAFDCSVARGSVYLLLSVELDWKYGGGDGGLRARLRFSLTGELVILKIASASILLALEAEYESGGALTATGTLDISIKICWCFTLSVKKDVKFRLAEKSKSSAAITQPAPNLGIMPMTAGNAVAIAAAVNSGTTSATSTVDQAIKDYFKSFGEEKEL